MYSAIRFLGVAGLLVASTAHPQSPHSALLNQIPMSYGTARQFSHSSARVATTSRLQIAGDHALLGRVEYHPSSAAAAGSTDAPIDGARALLGQWRVASPAGAGTTRQTSFTAQVRGDVVTSAAGEAEFGAIPAADGTSSGYTVSLGARGQQSAILFTRKSGGPLAVGRYRISDGGDGAAEIMALVMTGSPSNPTGVFRGRSGWLEVTAASDSILTAQFQVDGVGFLAVDPGVEDRPVSVAGKFTAAGSR